MTIEQIIKSVKKVGDPWLNPRTRLFEDGTYTGDGKDLIACRDIVHDLHKLWFEKGVHNGK